MKHFSNFAVLLAAWGLSASLTQALAFDVPKRSDNTVSTPAKAKPAPAPARQKQSTDTPASQTPAAVEDPLVRAQRDMLFLSAQSKYNAGDKVGALADWRELEKLGKPAADLYYWIGLAELDLEHVDAADEALKRNIRLSGGRGEHYQDVLALMQRVIAVRAALREKAEQIELTERNRVLVNQAMATGGTFKECVVCPKMQVIPAGTFNMGSPYAETKRFSDEGPQHPVQIKQFAAGVYAVTFDEWDACVADGGCNGHRPSDGGWGRGKRPVINVNWRQANAYTQWLSAKTNQTYRLLSEAEWEYAARAGTSTPFYTGACIDTSQANYDVASDEYNGCVPTAASNDRRTKPVGTYAANAFGLYDMAGNVRQWVEDAYHDNYGGAPGDGSAWTSGGDQTARVLRGGSWSGSLRILRSAVRYRDGATSADGNIGFRVARTL